MKLSWSGSDFAAQYVEGILENLKSDYPLTMTIIREKSGACSVQTVTEELLAGIDENSGALSFYQQQQSISEDRTQDG